MLSCAALTSSSAVFESWPPIIHAQPGDRMRLPVIAMQSQHGAVGYGALTETSVSILSGVFEQLIASSVVQALHLLDWMGEEDRHY